MMVFSMVERSAAMAWAVRKTVRAKRSRMVRIWAWVIIGLLGVSLWISWGNLWQTAADCVVIAALLVIGWKEDALNAYFAKHKALPGTSVADTAFCADHFLVKTAAAESRWQYDKILALAETGRTWFSFWARTTPWPLRRPHWRAEASRNSDNSWRKSPGRRSGASEDEV